MFEILDTIFEEVVVGIVLATGGILVGYFRKLGKVQSDLCKKVENLQRALIILASALDRQTNRLHEDADSSLDDLVDKLLTDKE
jgi:hypothetical protein